METETSSYKMLLIVSYVSFLAPGLRQISYKFLALWYKLCTFQIFCQTITLAYKCKIYY